MTVRRARPGGVPRAIEGDEAGFTLVEVLVAFVIITLATVLVIRIGTDMVVRGRGVEAVDVLIDEAEGIVLLRVASGTLRAGSEQGRFSDGRPWTLSVVDVAPRLGWLNVPPVWQVRLSEGGPAGRPIYATIVAAGLG